MMNRFGSRFLALLAPAAALPALCGCLAVAAAAGTGATVWYVKGDLEARVNAEPPQVSVATAAAMRDLDMHVLSEEATGIDAKIVGRTASDSKVTVTAKKTGDGLSSLSIRVGVFGDEQLSTAVYERIKARLAAEPQS